MCEVVKLKKIKEGCNFLFGNVIKGVSKKFQTEKLAF